MHFHGLPHTALNSGSFVGRNPDTTVPPGGSTTYVLPLLSGGDPALRRRA